MASIETAWVDAAHVELLLGGVAVDGEAGRGVVRVVRAVTASGGVVADFVLDVVDRAERWRDAVQPVVVVVGHRASRELGPEPEGHVVDTVEAARRTASLIVHDDAPVKSTGLAGLDDTTAEVDAVVHVGLEVGVVPAAGHRVELDLDRLRVHDGLGVDDGLGLTRRARTGIGRVLDAGGVGGVHVAVPVFVAVPLAGIATDHLHDLASTVLELDRREVRVAERFTPHRLEAELRGGDGVEDAELVELAIVIRVALRRIPVRDVLTHRVTVFGGDGHGPIDGHGVLRRASTEGEGQHGHEKQGRQTVHNRSSQGVVVAVHDRFLQIIRSLLSSYSNHLNSQSLINFSNGRASERCFTCPTPSKGWRTWRARWSTFLTEVPVCDPTKHDAVACSLVEADRRRASAAVAAGANPTDHDAGGDHADCRPEPPLLVDGVGLDDDGRRLDDEVRREGRIHLRQVDDGRLDQHGGRLDDDRRLHHHRSGANDDLRGRRLDDDLEVL